MTYDKASELVDLITHIAQMEIERSALDSDHWERADDLAHTIHTRRMRAIEILTEGNLE
jgi:hypothetical protein